MISITIPRLSPRQRLMIVVAVLVIVATLGLLFHEQIGEYAEHFWNDAIKWHVSPLIFVGLLFVTLIPYYKGWFAIARGLYAKDKAMLLRGAALNRAMWVIPYAYVLVFGHGYPWWVPTGVAAWIVIGTGIFLYNYRNKKHVAKMTNSFSGRLIGRLSKSLSKESQ